MTFVQAYSGRLSDIPAQITTRIQGVKRTREMRMAEICSLDTRVWGSNGHWYKSWLSQDQIEFHYLRRYEDILEAARLPSECGL